MESTVNRPAVDVGPQRARPGLALLLAVLAVPGSTIAWDLPAGGLWIGLPLALGAIVVGIRARRELAGEAGSRMAIAAIVLAVVAIAQMVVFVAASALS
jgi:hypothetical protein